MKIILSEEQLNFIVETITKNDINEIFNTNHSYPFNLNDVKEYENLTIYNYDFVTKDNLQYNIVLTILPDKKIGKIDFFTVDLNFNGININLIDLVNKNDTIKVFNTLKEIISKHKNEIDKLILSSTEDRLLFYEKLLTYMNIPHKKNKTGELIAILNPKNTPI